MIELLSLAHFTVSDNVHWNVIFDLMLFDVSWNTLLILLPIVHHLLTQRGTMK